MSDSGDIIRASVEAAGGRWETTVRAVRDAFGMSRLTAAGRRRIVVALREHDLRIEPGLVGTRLDDPVAVVDVRPPPEPPAAQEPVPAPAGRRMVVVASALAAVSLIAAILVATTGGGGDPAPPIAPAATAVAAGAASAAAPLVAVRVAAERVARLEREHAAEAR